MSSPTTSSAATTTISTTTTTSTAPSSHNPNSKPAESVAAASHPAHLSSAVDDSVIVDRPLPAISRPTRRSSVPSQPSPVSSHLLLRPETSPKSSALLPSLQTTPIASYFTLRSTPSGPNDPRSPGSKRAPACKRCPMNSLFRCLSVSNVSALLVELRNLPEKLGPFVRISLTFLISKIVPWD